MELEEMLGAQRGGKGGVAEPDRAQQVREKLTKDAEKSAAKLERMRNLRKRKMQSFMVIQGFLKKHVVPKYRGRQAAAAKEQLSHALRGAIQRKKFGKTKASIVKIQAVWRGAVCRMRVQAMLRTQRDQAKAAQKLQALGRGFAARARVKKMRFQDVMAQLALKYQAASVMQRLMRKFVAKVRDRKHHGLLGFLSFTLSLLTLLSLSVRCGTASGATRRRGRSNVPNASTLFGNAWCWTVGTRRPARLATC